MRLKTGYWTTQRELRQTVLQYFIVKITKLKIELI